LDLLLQILNVSLSLVNDEDASTAHAPHPNESAAGIDDVSVDEDALPQDGDSDASTGEAGGMTASLVERHPWRKS